MTDAPFSFSRPGSVPAAGAGKPGPPRQVTARGAVSAGVEHGALVLRAEDGGTYQLIGGDPAVVRPGRTVEVVGTLDPDLRSTGQEGLPLLVRTVRLVTL